MSLYKFLPHNDDVVDINLDDWKDPWPEPVIKQYNGVYVLRDDLINYGSKVRFLDYFVKHLPSTINWSFIVAHAKPQSFFWNVGA